MSEKESMPWPKDLEEGCLNFKGVRGGKPIGVVEPTKGFGAWVLVPISNIRKAAAYADEMVKKAGEEKLDETRESVRVYVYRMFVSRRRADTRQTSTFRGPPAP
jgi:hypothetical protein